MYISIKSKLQLLSYLCYITQLDGRHKAENASHKIGNRAPKRVLCANENEWSTIFGENS